MALGRNMQRDGQDLEFVVEVPMINGEPFELIENDWDVYVRGSAATVEVQCRMGVLSSVGSIPANAEVREGNLMLYCKSSKVPFGEGTLTIDMTIYAPHEKFEDEIQVLKTLHEVIDIYLI